MVDLNLPFLCACGNDRFVELTRWNRFICPLETDDRHPKMLLCWACRRIYRATPDYSWELYLFFPQA
jgi:hypothetical protein